MLDKRKQFHIWLAWNYALTVGLVCHCFNLNKFYSIEYLLVLLALTFSNLNNREMIFKQLETLLKKT